MDLVSSLVVNRVQNFPCFLLHQKKRRRRKRAKNHPGDTVGSNTHHLALKMAGNWRLYCSPDVKKETKRFVGVSGLHFEILPRERRVLLRVSLLKRKRFRVHTCSKFVLFSPLRLLRRETKKVVVADAAATSTFTNIYSLNFGFKRSEQSLKVKRFR